MEMVIVITVPTYILKIIIIYTNIFNFIYLAIHESFIEYLCFCISIADKQISLCPMTFTVYEGRQIYKILLIRQRISSILEYIMYTRYRSIGV